VDERTSGILVFNVKQGFAHPSIVVSLAQEKENPVCALAEI
jgi:hypothetical protein